MVKLPINPSPARSGHSWTPTEDETLLHEITHQPSRTLQDIAESHARSVLAITSRLDHLGLPIPGTVTQDQQNELDSTVVTCPHERANALLVKGIEGLAEELLVAQMKHTEVVPPLFVVYRLLNLLALSGGVGLDVRPKGA